MCAVANDSYTQEEYEDLAIEAVNKGFRIIPNITEECVKYSYEQSQIEERIKELKVLYMEGICSGQVSNRGACFD